MSILLQNLQYALRAFRGSPGFTAAAVRSLAIGIGANTALFSVASALLLTPLPYADAERLTIIWNRSPGLGIDEDWFSTAQYFDIKSGHGGFEQVAIAIGGNDNLTGDGDPERIGTIRMSSNLLPMLGARAEHGRLFVAEDDVPGTTGVAVLGHGTWTRRYGSDPAAIGLRGEHPDLYPPNGGLTFDIVPLQQQVVGDVRQSVLVLMGAVAFVLLIACANVANLMLSRALARQKEIAVRAALGASRARIVGQLLTESTALGLAGGAVGLLFATWSLEQMHSLGAGSVPRLGDISINRSVLLFTFAVSIVSGILFGLVPALRVSRVDLQGQLKDASRGGSGAGALWARGQNTRRVLVVAELALSVLLLIGAGLLIRSFARILDVPPGFNPTNTLTLELTMAGRKYADGTAVIEAYRQIWERLSRLPGVAASGGVSALPLSQMFAWGPITVEGRTPPSGEEFINAD